MFTTFNFRSVCSACTNFLALASLNFILKFSEFIIGVLALIEEHSGVGLVGGVALLSAFAYVFAFFCLGGGLDINPGRSGLH